MGSIDLENLFESLPPPIFAAQFCDLMRNQPDIESAVSTRQAIAITKLLMATCFRKGNLNLLPEDYIRAAIISTVPELQEVAEQVVLNILFPRLREIEEDTITQFGGKGSHPGQISADATVPEKMEKDLSTDVLEGLSDFLSEVAPDFDSRGVQPSGGQSQDEQTDELDFFFLANGEWKAGRQPFKSLLDTLDSQTDILYRQIQNLPQLTQYVKQRMMPSINQLSRTDLAAIPHADVSNEIMQKTKNPVEQALAQHAVKQTSGFKETSQQILSDSPVDYTRMARALSESGSITKETFQEMVETAAQQAKTSSEIYNIIKTAETLTPKMKEKLFDMIGKEPSLTKALEIASSLEKLPSITDPILMDFLKQTLSKPETASKISFRTLPYIPFYSKDIENAVERAFQKEMSKLQEAKRPGDFSELYDEIMDTRDRTQNAYYQKVLKDLQNQTGNEWLQSITSPKSFLNVGHQLARQKLEFDEEKVMSHGLEIGCNKEEINEFLYSSFEKFLKAIKEGTRDARGYTTALKRLKLKPDQMQQAMDTAFQSENREALAAFASQDLATMTQQAAKSGNSQKLDLLLSSLSAGSGEDLLRQWFIHRDRIPSQAREKLRRVLRKIVIATAMDMARMRLGSAEDGLMVANTIRPYRDGDEFDQIDIEGTLDGIISMGKDLTQIVPEDLMMHERKRGRVALLVLLDVSGSMSAVERLSYCALLVTLLISRLKEQEIAIALFESNTHVIMEFEEEKPEIEKIIDQLLEIRARGGTVVNRALAWALKQFQKVEAEKTYFVALSDFILSREVGTDASFHGILKFKPKTYLIAPAKNIQGAEIKMWQKALNASAVTLKSERDIIDIVCKIISSR